MPRPRPGASSPPLSLRKAPASSEPRATRLTPREPARDLPAFALVKLLRELRGDGGEVIPEGSTGAIVEIYEPGIAYAVEFAQSGGLVATVPRDALVPA